jgi:hypothetical protein
VGLALRTGGGDGKALEMKDSDLRDILMELAQYHKENPDQDKKESGGKKKKRF